MKKTWKFNKNWSILIKFLTIFTKFNKFFHFLKNMIFNFFTYYKNYFMKNHVFEKVEKLINFCKNCMKFNQNWLIFVKFSCFFHFFCLFFNFLFFSFFSWKGFLKHFCTLFFLRGRVSRNRKSEASKKITKKFIFCIYIYAKRTFWWFFCM